jgi:hypothetical protein
MLTAVAMLVTPGWVSVERISGETWVFLHCAGSDSVDDLLIQEEIDSCVLFRYGAEL